MAICTKDQVKTHLYGTTTPTTYDTLFDQLIGQVEDMIKHETGVVFVGTDYDTISDEIVNGTGRNKIFAKYQPIRTLTKIEYRDASGDWTEYTTEDISTMEVDGYKIYPLYSIVEKGMRNLRLNYTVGYKTSETPSDLNLAGILLVAHLFNTREETGIDQTSVMGLTMTMSKEQNQFVKKIITKYKQVRAY